MILHSNEVAEIATPTGPMRTYLFRPVAEGRYPGIVLYSEIFQLTGPIRRTASFLAGHGYIVAVPEIYHELEPAGTVLAYDQAGADHRHRERHTADTERAMQGHSTCRDQPGLQRQQQVPQEDILNTQD